MRIERTTLGARVLIDPARIEAAWNGQMAVEVSLYELLIALEDAQIITRAAMIDAHERLGRG